MKLQFCGHDPKKFKMLKFGSFAVVPVGPIDKCKESFFIKHRRSMWFDGDGRLRCDVEEGIDDLVIKETITCGIGCEICIMGIRSVLSGIYMLFDEDHLKGVRCAGKVEL